MPLIVAPINQEVKVIKILTDEKIKKYLESLGITVNSKITILSICGGNVICIVKDGRLALDRNIATKIFVA